MPDRHAPGWEQQLLDRAARETRYPATPALAGAVLDRISRPAPRPVPGRRALVPLAALAAFALALAASLLLSNDAREAVAGFLGLAVENERIEPLPRPPAGTTPTPLPSPQPTEEFATPVTFTEAVAALGFRPAVPPAYGEPLRYYLLRYVDRPVVILQYGEFDLWEADDVVFEKGVVFAKGVAAVEELTVRGRPAYWIDGGGHILQVLDGQGQAVGPVRTVDARTLVWRGAGRNYRLETKTLTKAEAVAIAESLP